MCGVGRDGGVGCGIVCVCVDLMEEEKGEDGWEDEDRDLGILRIWELGGVRRLIERGGD